MIRFFLPAACLALGLSSLNAQKIHRFALKTDLTAALDRRFSFAGEWFRKENNSWEIQAAYEKIPGADVFNGSWTVDYAKQQLKYHYDFTPHFHLIGQPDFIGSGRPLPAVPVYTGISILQFGLSHRVYFQPAQSRWRFILQPTLAATRHRYCLSEDRTQIVRQVSYDQPIEGGVVEFRKTVFYRQTREMTYHDKWMSSLSGAFILQHNFKSRLSLEARLTSGLNFGGRPEPEIREAQPRFRKLYGYGSVLLGYRFS